MWRGRGPRTVRSITITYRQARRRGTPPGFQRHALICCVCVCVCVVCLFVCLFVCCLLCANVGVLWSIVTHYCCFFLVCLRCVFVDCAQADAAKGTPATKVIAGTAWSQVTTAEGEVYYFNRDTKEVTWDRPVDVYAHQPLPLCICACFCLAFSFSFVLAFLIVVVLFRPDDDLSRASSNIISAGAPPTASAASAAAVGTDAEMSECSCR